MFVSEIVLYASLLAAFGFAGVAIWLGQRSLLVLSVVCVFVGFVGSAIVLNVVDNPRFERECESRGGTVIVEGIDCYKNPVERIDIP